MSGAKVQPRAWIGAAFGGCALALLLAVGVLALYAYQSFQTFTLRARVAEAPSQLTALRTGISTYAMQEISDPTTGTFRLRGLPPSLPRTPGAPGAARQGWPASADPLWAELGLYTSEGLYYAYEVTSDASTNTVIVRAVGDLDGDGVLSDFSERGVLDPSTGEISWDAVSIVDELE